LGRLLLSSTAERAERNFRFEEGGRVSGVVGSLVAGTEGIKSIVGVSDAGKNGSPASSRGGVTTGVLDGDEAGGI